MNVACMCMCLQELCEWRQLHAELQAALLAKEAELSALHTTLAGLGDVQELARQAARVSHDSWHDATLLHHCYVPFT